MGLWARIGRFWRGVLLLAVGLVGGAAAVAVATVPDSSGVIHGCYSVTTGAAKTAVPSTGGPNLTVIDPSAGETCDTTTSASGAPPTQRELDWNISGPQGAPGQPGTPGPQGPPGNTATVTKGGTLTLSGGQVLQVEGAGGGVTLPTPRQNLPGGSEVTIGGLSFPILDVSQLGAGAGGGRGGVAVKDLSITKTIDKASPTLFQMCASGQHIPKVTITVRKAGSKKYLRYTLSQVFITSIQTAGSGGQNKPAEQVTFSYGSIQYQYVKQ
ncbi:MAG TPA: type VI secretion system tube protein Hcp [Solirubrobacteraceae bacterium]|nr:type VI secretion system tube protein Hcp [Solirubrobacteraceae bacterium]